MDPSCETKPASRLRISDCELRIEDRPAADGCPAACRLCPTEGKMRKTNPICRPVASVPAGRSCETKPISVGAELELNRLSKKSYALRTRLIGSAKQSQFSPRCRSGDRRSRDPNVQNEANLGGPAAPASLPVWHQKSAVQTKPIRRKPAGGGWDFRLRTAAEDLQSGDLLEDQQ